MMAGHGHRCLKIQFLHKPGCSMEKKSELLFIYSSNSIQSARDFSPPKDRSFFLARIVLQLYIL